MPKSKNKSVLDFSSNIDSIYNITKVFFEYINIIHDDFNVIKIFHIHDNSDHDTVM